MVSVFSAQKAIGEPQRGFLAFAKIESIPNSIYAYPDLEVNLNKVETVASKVKAQSEAVSKLVSGVEVASNEVHDGASAVLLGQQQNTPTIFREFSKYYCLKFPWPSRKVSSAKLISGGDYVTFAGQISSKKDGIFEFLVDEPHRAWRYFNRLFEATSGMTRTGRPIPGAGVYPFRSGTKAYRKLPGNELKIGLYQLATDRTTISDYLLLRNCQVLEIEEIPMDITVESASIFTFKCHICWDYVTDDVKPGTLSEHQIIGQQYGDGFDAIVQMMVGDTSNTVNNILG